ncbi:MAG: class I SAM-dependent methyltransferase [Chloroflexi bacterium]|nr:class I SAM-dependent methyltransferase [Chloroflexota bacterium]
MKPQVTRRLIRLNAAFYQTFAAEFAESRAAIQPGIRRALAEIANCRSILDIGCGDGRVAQALAKMGWAGRYIGVDFSERLIELARARELTSLRATFIKADISRRDWTGQLPRQSFDAALAFAVFHHIPGARRRIRLMRQIISRLKPGGLAVVSTWQFLSDERLKRKIAPWSRIGLTSSDVEEADYLLDWKRGGEGLRYVCALGETELRELARAAGCEVLEMWRADGRTGELSLYTVLRVEEGE